MLKLHAVVQGGSIEHVEPLSVTFDAVFSAFARLPRMFIEPDGSFVWTGTTADGERWQVDGNLVDRGDVLAYVELKGCCPEKEFDLLLGTIGWPDVPLFFQLTQRGVVLDEANFRRSAESELGAV